MTITDEHKRALHDLVQSVKETNPTDHSVMGDIGDDVKNVVDGIVAMPLALLFVAMVLWDDAHGHIGDW
jgi:hypothetical protein